jgi:AcrR family transcriptional regulator
MPVHNPRKDADQKAANRRKLLEAGYRLFTGKTIDGVSLEMVAKEAGIGVATLYRYFGSKTDLAIAVSVWKWQEYLEQIRHRTDVERQDLT